MTLAERRAALLRKLGRSLEEVRLNFEALTPQAVACLKTEKGYELVSPPKGLNKLFYARTSGKECGQRQLGKGFETAELAAREVFLWIIGIIDTPPTPSRVKDRNARGQGVRKKDRRNHGKGACFAPSPLTPRSHSAIPPSQVARTCASASTGRRRRSERSTRPLALGPLWRRVSRDRARCSPPPGRRSTSLRRRSMQSSCSCCPGLPARLCKHVSRDWTCM